MARADNGLGVEWLVKCCNSALSFKQMTEVAK